MADFENIRDAKNELAIASLHLAVLFAPMSTPSIDTLEDPATGDLVTLTGYSSAGLIEKGAGVNIGTDDTSTDIESYGDGDPVRTIISKRTVSFQANFLETNYQTLEKYWGKSLTSVTPTTYGGVVIEAPTLPNSIYYRCILLGQDDVNGMDLFPYWIMPRVKLDTVDGQNLKDDGTMMYNMTFKAFRDSSAGFSVAQGFTGPGWTHLVSRAGFVTAPTGPLTVSAAPGSTALSALTVSAGATHTSQLRVVGSNGINYTPLATFSSSAPAKATVSASGLVTGVSSGAPNPVITASYLPPGTDVPLTGTANVTVT